MDLQTCGEKKSERTKILATKKAKRPSRLGKWKTRPSAWFQVRMNDFVSTY
jgi:hypothetical protein